MQEVTGLTVCWNTKNLIEKALRSVRNFHPDMKIVVIDGSSRHDLCYQYLDQLVRIDTNLTVDHVNRNIGHGKGLHRGIEKIRTRYALIFDSDIVMVQSPVTDMLAMMEEDTYGVGYTEITGYDGFEYGVHPIHNRHRPVKYLHPYFQLLQIREYKKYKPYIHHGAPCIAAMLDLHLRGLSDKVIKEFPGLGHTSGYGLHWRPCDGKYILHDVAQFGGTGRMRISRGLDHIEGAWDRSYLKGVPC